MRKLSVIEIGIQSIAVLVVIPLLVVLLTPTTDAITLGMYWLLGVAVFEFGFFVIRRYVR